MSLELAPMRELSELRTLIVRFLVKVGFFSVMTVVGFCGVDWIPMVDPNDLNLVWLDLVETASCFCFGGMFFGGIAGLTVTVFTGGHKPHWN